MTMPSPDPYADVAAALDALRESVRAALPATHSSPAEAAFRRALAEVESTRAVSAQWPLVAQRLADRPVVLLHRAVRRYLRWYVGRIVEQQNATNEGVARALALLGAQLRELQAAPGDTPAAPRAEARREG